METEVTANLTTVGPDRQIPCYEQELAHTVKNTPSITCVLLCILVASLSVIIICGNLLVVISVIYFKQLHTPTNYLIVSLAVADLLIGMIVCPFNIAFPNTLCIPLYDFNIFCEIGNNVTTLLVLCSVLNLGCISIDRYYAVCHPLTYRTKMSQHAVTIMILVSWGFPALLIPCQVFVDLHHDSCIINQDYFCLQSMFSFAVVILFLPLFILICIVCLYLKIFIVAQRQVRSIQNTTCQSTKSGATVSNMERKATKTLGIVLGVYLLCWLPYLVYTSLISIAYSILNSEVIEDVLLWINISNSMFNPFIYAFFYSWFRSAIRMIVSGKMFRGDFSNTQLH